VGRTVRALGANGPRAIEVYLISKVFWQSFSRKISSERTVCGFTTDNPKLTSKHTEWCAARVDRADSPRGPGGQSARLNRQLWQQLTSRFTVGIQTQTVLRPSRTVRKVHIFDITASNGKGEYKYSMPGLESLFWHFERFILRCRALPLLYLTHLA
jgi:hypothetical protein